MASNKPAKLFASSGVYIEPRGPVSMQAARKQNQRVDTRAKAVKELRSAGIVTRSGNLKPKFKKK
jgi:hypothetical protein